MAIKDGNWYDEMWNPMTGSISTWPFRYSKEYCNRFKGDIRFNLSSDRIKKLDDEHFILEKPFEITSDKHYLDCPAGTYPTFHEYRLNQITEKYITGRNLLVCAMGELFAEDTPSDWIYQILSIASKNPQHNYIFTSSNESYIYILGSFAHLLTDSMWFGIKPKENLSCLSMYKGNQFLFLEDINKASVNALDSMCISKSISWILAIPGKETTDYEIYKLINFSKEKSIPLYIDGDWDGMPHDLPENFKRHTVSPKRKNLTWAKCGGCKGEFEKKQMHTIGSYVKRGEGYKVIGYLCDECYEKFRKQFQEK